MSEIASPIACKKKAHRIDTLVNYLPKYPLKNTATNLSRPNI